MGFLNKRERILDFSLTDKGRELLSKNILNFTFYAFSDDGVDYSGALTSSLLPSGSVDEYIRKTFTFEADQYKNSKEQTDLKSFLYTVPEKRNTLPKFITNFDDRVDISAIRRYYIDVFSISARVQNVSEKPVGVVLRTTQDKSSVKQKLENFVTTQKISETQERLNSNKNVVGNVIGKNAVMLSPSKVLETNTGKVFTLSSYVEKNQANGQNVNALSISEDVEVVTGLDRVKINFELKSTEGRIDASNGFLVEVFESGSDGKLTKLFEENVVDALEENILLKGFSNDLFIDVDVSLIELVSESERLRKQELRRQKLIEDRLRRELENKIKNTTFSDD